MKTAKARSGPPIPRAIWALGFVSLFTDMGSEMVHGLVPLLLAGSLGASALMIGLIEGTAEALVLTLVLLGYGLATAVKPLFPLADSATTVTTARLLDCLGKGIRGAPRDALVGDISCRL